MEALSISDLGELMEACFQASEYLDRKMETNNDYDSEDVESMEREIAIYTELSLRLSAERESRIACERR